MFYLGWRETPAVCQPLEPQARHRGSGGSVSPVKQNVALAAASGASGPTAATTPSFLTVPAWCAEPPYNNGNLWADRVEGCWTSNITMISQKLVNDVWVTDGELPAAMLSYIYGDPSKSTVAFQLNLSPGVGWGAMLDANVWGSPYVGTGGGCTVGASDFPPTPVSPPAGFKQGIAYYDTTATAAGAVATCDQGFTMYYAPPGYSPGAYDFHANALRCDNATAGVSTPGCVVPWAAAWLVYKAVDNPTLVQHVQAAQGSGLPGAPGGTPLTRSTDATEQAANYARACYQVPSMTNYSCDEYPFKTTHQGLANDANWQSDRRTFSFCFLPSLPSQTGPVGVSACMIPQSEQNSQGGLNSNFYREWRELDGDPFYVSLQ